MFPAESKALQVWLIHVWGWHHSGCHKHPWLHSPMLLQCRTHIHIGKQQCQRMGVLHCRCNNARGFSIEGWRRAKGWRGWEWLLGGLHTRFPVSICFGVHIRGHHGRVLQARVVHGRVLHGRARHGQRTIVGGYELLQHNSTPNVCY